MRRSLLMAVGIMALALAVPSAALAHHGRGHHHNKAMRKAHHAKFRIVHIGAGASTTTTPTTPTIPPAPEKAGTVTSYTGGVLTLTLNDGSTVSGKVTADTRIGCIKATPTTPPTGQPTDGNPGDDKGEGDDQNRGDMNQQGDHESGEWQHSDHDNGGGGGDDDNEEVHGAPEPPCDTSALVAGAAVGAAELRIGPGGTEFESVWLVR